jgi:ribosomal protein S18 acetylase RimI-like enzyme
MKDFWFTNDHSEAGAATVIDVLRRPRLGIPTHTDYPDFDEWLSKTEAKIQDSRKRAMLAFHGGKAVGAIVYGRHETEPGMLAIRNISVEPEASGRYVASFLLRNVEVEARDHDYAGVNQAIVDTKTVNNSMLLFLARHGYQIQEITDLYGLGAGLDAVLMKPLEERVGEAPPG